VNILARLADRLVLNPTTHPIDPGEFRRETIDVGGQTLEAWSGNTNAANAKRNIFMVKFPGTGGRAERSSLSPCHLWEDVAAEIWTINPFGYGGSEGPASMQSFPRMVDAVYAEIRKRFPDHKLIVYGNSLGTLSAIAMAARHQVEGLYLRNCVPIHQLIASRPRYAWPSLGLSRFVARQIPAELNAVDNSRLVSVPALFVMSARDRVVPPRFQAQVHDAFHGPKRVFTIPNADHHESIPEDLADSYIAELNWLRDSIFEES
jgi:pimeloyl-ACP methyl ester carboxylesterase